MASPFFVRSGCVSIPVYSCRDGRSLVVWREAGRKIRRPYRCQDKARAIALGAAERIAAGRSIEMSIADRESFLYCKKALSSLGVPITLAVDQFVASRKGKTSGLGRAVDEFVASKADHLFSPRYARALKHDLRDFVGFIGPDRELRDIAPGDIEAFLRGKAVGIRRRNNLRDTLVTFFRWARDRGYLPELERTAPEKVPRIRARPDQISIYSPAEIDLFLGSVREEWLPWIALGAFAGIRTEEISRLNWSDFNFEKGFVDIRPAIAKTGYRRKVPLRKNLLTWLSQWLERRIGRVVPGHRRDREIERLYRATGIKWRNNALRHSYGSYRAAEIQDLAAVSYEMGNSIPIIKRHYDEVVHKTEAERWFAISAPEPGNVIQLDLGIGFERKAAYEIG